MNKIPLLSRLMKTKFDEVMHTSGYARVQQNSSNVSTNGTQSFTERQAVNDRRQYVRGYRDSRLGANPYNRRITSDSPSSVNCNDIKNKNVNDNPSSTPPVSPQNNSRPTRNLTPNIKPNIHPKF